MVLSIDADEAPGVKIALTPISFRYGKSLSWIIPPPKTMTSSAPFSVEQVDHSLEQDPVGIH